LLTTFKGHSLNSLRLKTPLNWFAKLVQFLLFYTPIPASNLLLLAPMTSLPRPTLPDMGVAQLD